MIVNLAASVRARLMNHARKTSRPFQEVFQYYANERPDKMAPPLFVAGADKLARTQAIEVLPMYPAWPP